MPWCRLIEKASKPFLSFGINIKALPVDFNVPVMVEGRGDCNQEEKAEALCKEGWAGCHTGCHYFSKCSLDDQVLGLATGESWSCLWKRLWEAPTQSLTVFPQLRLEGDNRHTSADDCFGLYWKQVFIVLIYYNNKGCITKFYNSSFSSSSSSSSSFSSTSLKPSPSSSSSSSLLTPSPSSSSKSSRRPSPSSSASSSVSMMTKRIVFQKDWDLRWRFHLRHHPPPRQGSGHHHRHHLL